VLSLHIRDPARFFSEFVCLAEKKGVLKVQVDGSVISGSDFCQELRNDFFDDVINLKILSNCEVVLSYHDSLEDCFAEESVHDIIDQLARRSLVSYKVWPLVHSSPEVDSSEDKSEE